VSAVATSRKDLVPVTDRDLRVGDRDGSLMVGREVIAVGETSDGRVELTVKWSRTGRTEKFPVKAGWSGRVKRPVVGSGLALRRKAKARTTKGVVEVWDTQHPESDIPSSAVRGHRWAMRCEHGTVIGRQTLERATEDALDPRLWCLTCVLPTDALTLV